MNITKLTENLNIIQTLPDQPTKTASELKQEFDKAGNKIKEYINDLLIPDVTDGVSKDIKSSETSIMNKVQPVLDDLETKINDELSELETKMQELINTTGDKKTVYGDFIVAQTPTYSISNGNGGYGSHSTTISKAGYLPLGVVGHVSTSTNHYNNTSMGSCITNIYLTNLQVGSCTLNARTHVKDNGAWTYSSTYSAFILWVKVK